MNVYTLTEANKEQDDMHRLQDAHNDAVASDGGLAVGDSLDISKLTQNERRRVLTWLCDFINAEYDAHKARFDSL